MKNNNRKVAQKYQWPYLWIRIYIFTLNEEQDKINTVMEDRKLSEKESLDIITQMINSSKRNMKVGSGNVLLYWGYFTVLLSVVISSLIVYTQNYIWSWINLSTKFHITSWYKITIATFSSLIPYRVAKELQLLFSSALIASTSLSVI